MDGRTGELGDVSFLALSLSPSKFWLTDSSAAFCLQRFVTVIVISID